MTGSRWLAAAFVALALAGAGCGGDDEDDAGTQAEQAPAQTQDETPQADESGEIGRASCRARG